MKITAGKKKTRGSTWENTLGGDTSGMVTENLEES
jgi:hypothetical protein